MEAAARKSHAARWQEAQRPDWHIWTAGKKTGKMYEMLSIYSKICINLVRFLGTKNLMSSIFPVPPEKSDRWQTQRFFYHQTWLHHIIIGQWCWTPCAKWPFFIHRHVETWCSLLDFHHSLRELLKKCETWEALLILKSTHAIWGEIQTAGVLEKGIKLSPTSFSLKFSDLDAKGSEWKTDI